MSRVAGGARLFDRREREVLRKMLWRVAAFAGVEVIAYCIMSNHYHILVRVPEAHDVDDAELLRRYRILYPDGVATTMPDARVLESILSDSEGELAREWRRRLLRRMHDVSEFMRTLNQRFTAWFNKSHQRFGTLWAERFKSVLVEDDPRALTVVAAYIDLNPVRAGLADDPADYRWSSYGEAMGGGRRARHGLMSAVGALRPDGSMKRTWLDALADYRMVLFGKGAQGKIGEQGAIPQEKALKVLEQGGKVPLSDLLRCRVRYLSDGLIFGSESFVRAVGATLPPSGVPAASHGLGTFPAAELSSLRTWRRLQVRRFG